jgi:MFS family permease
VHDWRRNQVAVTAAAFVGFTGFTLVMPFLPLYIRQLGVEDVGDVALWVGATLGVTPAITALCAPLWGRVGDRYGNKILVQRSLLSFILVMAAMAYVSRAWATASSISGPLAMTFPAACVGEDRVSNTPTAIWTFSLTK